MRDAADLAVHADEFGGDVTHKHTPGPWRRGKNADLWIYASAPGTQLIAKVCSSGDNANLIVAAPDLLQATKDLLRAFEEVMPGLAHIAVKDYANVNTAPIRARQAIEKAEAS